MNSRAPIVAARRVRCLRSGVGPSRGVREGARRIGGSSLGRPAVLGYGIVSTPYVLALVLRAGWNAPEAERLTANRSASERPNFRRVSCSESRLYG